MTTAPNAIHKKRAPPLVKLARTVFLLPQGNRYFARVMGDRGVLAKSQCDNGEEEADEEVRLVQDISKTEVIRTQVIRSASLQLSRKASLLREKGKVQSQMQLHSLPKIHCKIIKNRGDAVTAPPREIIKSELGCFSSFDILRRKEEQSEKRRLGNHLTRLSSFLSEEEPLDGELPQKGETSEHTYEEYDRVLMEPEPVLYKQRMFKLKHKADWSISTTVK